MEAKIIPFYAGILVFVYMFYSGLVINLRRTLKIGIGSGGKEDMQRAIRVHANFNEYVPLTLLMLLFLELNGTNSTWLHVGGTALVIGRILHGLGLSQNAGTSAGRFVGILINYLILIIGAGALIKGYFAN